MAGTAAARFRSIARLLLLGAVLLGSLAPAAGRLLNQNVTVLPQARIVGGTVVPTPATTYPYAARLVFAYTFNTGTPNYRSCNGRMPCGFTLSCGGSLISPTAVLTGAAATRAPLRATRAELTCSPAQRGTASAQTPQGISPAA